MTPLIGLLRAVTTRVPVALFDRLNRLLAWPFMLFTMALDATGVRRYRGSAGTRPRSP